MFDYLERSMSVYCLSIIAGSSANASQQHWLNHYMYSFLEAWCVGTSASVSRLVIHCVRENAWDVQ